MTEWTPGHRFFAVAYLKEMGPAARPAVPALLAALDDDVPLRIFIIRALGGIPDRGEAADDALRRYIHDNNAYVRAAAMEALGRSWKQ